MDLRARRGLIGSKESDELYPVGRDILAKFAWQSNKGIDSKGEVYDKSQNNVKGPVEIDPTYTYQKNAYRVTKYAYYDANDNYLGEQVRYNTNIENVPMPYSNARYLRVQVVDVQRGLAITRIA